jgi:hypothetical protein
MWIKRTYVIVNIGLSFRGISWPWWSIHCSPAGTLAASFGHCDYKRNYLIGQCTHSCVIHIRRTFSSVFPSFMVHGHRWDDTWSLSVNYIWSRVQPVISVTYFSEHQFKPVSLWMFPQEVFRTELSPCSVSLGLPIALNTAFQWFVPLLYAREVWDSNLVQEAACPDVGFLWFSSESL